MYIYNYIYIFIYVYDFPGSHVWLPEGICYVPIHPLMIWWSYWFLGTNPPGWGQVGFGNCWRCSIHWLVYTNKCCVHQISRWPMLKFDLWIKYGTPNECINVWDEMEEESVDLPCVCPHICIGKYVAIDFKLSWEVMGGPCYFAGRWYDIQALYRAPFPL